jgi:predicted MPP superfamily phosphohydrolase
MPEWRCAWCHRMADGDIHKPDQCEHCETKIGHKSPAEGLAPLPNKRGIPTITPKMRERLEIRDAAYAEAASDPAFMRDMDAVSDKPPARSPLEPALCVSDAHIPFHSKAWWSLMMQVARDIKPTTIVIIGDFADFYAVSDHDKDPERANRFDEEIEVVEKHLDELDALGATDKIYVEGNHEDRLRRYLMKNPALARVVTTEKLLRLKERGWEFVPYKRHTQRGAIHYTHDVGSAGRNAIFRALDTYQHSVVTGHTHRLQYIVEGNAVGDCKLSAAFGCGLDIDTVDYTNLARAKKDWANGFGVGYLDNSSGLAYWVPVPVVHKTCMVNGKLYRAAV